MHRLFGLLAAASPILLCAQPQTPQVVAGNASFEQASDACLQVTTSDKAIIHWDNFSIQPGEITRFVQPNAGSAVLNRVMEGNPSHLLGALEANGKVYLLNPAGILIGKDAVIQTASFIASTLDVLDEEFLAHDSLHFAGASKESIVHYGRITAENGDVILLAYQIDHEGESLAPRGTVAIGAGQNILLQPEGAKVWIRPNKQAKSTGANIRHTGRIEAMHAELQAERNPFALAMNHKSSSDAIATCEVDGEIFLMASPGKVSVAGSVVAPQGCVQILGDEICLQEGALVDVSGPSQGGAVLIGGDYQGKNPLIPNAAITLISQGVCIHADALENGDGGKVIVWGDQTARFAGEITARGGAIGGDGGFVEVSSPGMLVFDGFVATGAPMGKTGTLFLDPCAVTISAAADTAAGCPWDFTGFAAFNINTTTLQTCLDAPNNVIIDASGSGMVATGTISVTDPLSWAGTGTLTLQATDMASTIDILNTVQALSGGFGAATAAISLTAPTVNIGASSYATPNPSSLEATTGKVSISATSSLNLYGGSAMVNDALISANSTGNVEILGGGTLLLDPGPNGGEASIQALQTIDIGTALVPMGATTLGTTTAQGAAFIATTGASSNAITLYCTDLSLQGGNNSAGSQASISTLGDGTIAITATGAGGISLLGGDVDGSSDAALTTAALIKTYGTTADSAINITTTDLLVKAGAVPMGSSYAEARIETARGNITIAASGNIVVGDNGALPIPTCSSYIESGTALAGGSNNITIQCNNLTCKSVAPSLVSGFVAGGFAQIYCRTNGTISFQTTGDATFTGGDATATGGNYPASQAGIVVQDGGAITTGGGSVGGKLIIDGTLGSAGIVSGSVINNSPPFPLLTPATTFTITVLGDCLLTAGEGLAGLGNRDNGNVTLNITGDLSLQGGSSTTAMVPIHGFAGVFTSVASGATGNVDITANTVSITGGTAFNSNAGASNIAGISTGQVLGGSSGNGSVSIHTTGPGTGVGLTGGTAQGCFAFIGAFGALSTDSVTIASDAGDVILQAGPSSSTHAYIQTASADLTLTTGGNCSLTAAGGRASIGNLSGGGDVTCTITGDLTIQGGSSATAPPNHSFAGIFAAATGGVGNVDVTANGASIAGGALDAGAPLNFGGIFTGNSFPVGGDGNVSLHTTGGPVSLFGGMATNCPAFLQIITSSPGYSLSLQNDTNAALTLTSGINPTSHAFIQTQVSPIDITGFGDISLTADGGFAAIITQSGGDITVSATGDIVLQGGTSTTAFPNNSFAGIIGALQSGTGNLDITANSITATGGSTANVQNLNYAGVGTGDFIGGTGGDGTVSVHVTGAGVGGYAIHFMGGPAQRNPAVMHTLGTASGNTLSITSDTAGFLFVGGVGDFSAAAIETLTNLSSIDISIAAGTSAFLGGIGDQAEVRIFTQGTDAPLTVDFGSSSASFTGGSNTDASATLLTFGDNSPIQIPAAGALTFTGGSVPSPSNLAAGIVSNGNNSPISVACGPLSLTGCSAPTSAAVIISTFGADGAISLDVAGDVTFTGLFSFFTAAITQGGGISPISLTATGDVHLTAQDGITAITSLNSGDISCAIGGDYIIQGGTGGNSPAGIAAASTGNGNLSISGQNIFLTAGTSSGMPTPSLAFLGCGINGGSGSVDIVCNGSSGIHLTGGTAAGANAMILSGGGASDSVTLTAPNPSASLTLTSNVGQAAIMTFGGSIIDPVGSDIILAGTAMSPATIAVGGGGSGSLLLIAGRNISLNAYSSISNASTGGITLVCDNAYPVPPLIGTATFTTEAGSSIDALIGGGVLRIFTARQPLVTINGTLNGAAFVPGVEYFDTDQEHWQVYYGLAGSSFVNPNSPFFTIFYKDPQSVVPPLDVIYASSAFLTEYIPSTFEAVNVWDIHFAYNQIKRIPTPMRYNRQGNSVQNTKISSFDVVPDKDYPIAREQNKNYRTLKLDSL